ncbi:hypothetical protein EIN_154870 [Entamoeba invadens IP1]|uniref:Uncharacterized protein n=1 Tax=Entamoeba invadens IP1 TaxID=370355 RepID=A0A0A1U911_ENTIV|nr:hypothetical protein EIN_154870 [Entamoeba invadens IP1]ELP91400.1 hypothetical protein EIN_154870 [Entamoeba invadens IP1]|eukprot:XP_004258171.1 hypothetical protein EIN_154870 [Entamoeba invadens IP1]
MSKEVPLLYNKELKEDEIVLSQFENVVFENLQVPIKLVKNVPNPEVNEKIEEKKRRKYYKLAISESPFLLTSGGTQPAIPSAPSQPITSFTSRKVRDQDKFALIQLEDDGTVQINVLDEYWIFNKKFESTKNLSNIAPEEEKAEKETEPTRQRHLPGENSDEEQNSHFSDRYADDDDEFNPGGKNDSFSTSSDSENEKKSRKRGSETQKPQTKIDLKEAIIKELKANGEEMYADALFKKFNPEGLQDLNEKIGKICQKIVDATAEENGPTLFSLKQNIKKRERREKRSEKKKSEKKEKKN